MSKLLVALYSLNKYAKKYRDEERKDLERSLYDMKEEALSYFTPSELHIQIVKVPKYLYEGDPEFLQSRKLKAKLFYVPQTGLYQKRKVKIVPKIKYYLYYKIQDFRFHVPVDRQTAFSFCYLPQAHLPQNFRVPSTPTKPVLSEEEAVATVLSFLKSKKEEKKK